MDLFKFFEQLAFVFWSQRNFQHNPLTITSDYLAISAFANWNRRRRPFTRLTSAKQKQKSVTLPDKHCKIKHAFSTANCPYLWQAVVLKVTLSKRKKWKHRRLPVEKKNRFSDQVGRNKRVKSWTLGVSPTSFGRQLSI